MKTLFLVSCCHFCSLLLTEDLTGLQQILSCDWLTRRTRTTFLSTKAVKSAVKRALNSNVGQNGPTRIKKSPRKQSCALSPIVSCNVKKRKVSVYYKRPISVKHVVRLPTFSLVLYFKCCWKMGCFCDSSPLIWFLLRFSFFSVYVCYHRHIKEICDVLLISYSYIWLINFKRIFIPFSFH